MRVEAGQPREHVRAGSVYVPLACWTYPGDEETLDGPMWSCLWVTARGDAHCLVIERSEWWIETYTRAL